MTTVLEVLFIGYGFLSIFYFSLYGFYNVLYSLAALRGYTPKITADYGNPKVAVVIVSYNEKEVLEDTVMSCLSLSYKNKSIIVSDDSNDEGAITAIQRIAKKAGCLVRIGNMLHLHETTDILQSEELTIFHRRHNTGFKAGNLQHLLPYLRRCGFEYMYLLDSDWHPQPDALERCIEVIRADKTLAYVQTKRLTDTRNLNNLQRVLALSEEACYVTDLSGRAAVGDFLLFTGCCTLFDLTKLHTVGGFTPGHLTEDIDLANRIYLKGYRATYLESVHNYGEVPPSYSILRRQQDRWCMGSARACKEYFLPIILSKTLRWPVKLSMLRQNSYFTGSIVIFIGMIAGLLQFIFSHVSNTDYGLLAWTYRIQPVLFWFYPLSLFLLSSGFLPLVITLHKQKRLKDWYLIPLTAWISHSLFYTYLLANYKGFAGVTQNWIVTPKTNRSTLASALPKSLDGKHLLLNAVTAAVLLIVYGSDFVTTGTIQPYAFLWLPALFLGAVLV